MPVIEKAIGSMGSEAVMTLLERVGERVRQAGVFRDVLASPGELRCDAMHVESEASYRVTVEQSLWVGLYTPDRWLSESIEAELMHVGDRIEDLLEEELVDQGYEGGKLTVEHFRDDDKQFVFRSPLPLQPEDAQAAERLTKVLLAYEACFRELGDMRPADETV